MEQRYNYTDWDDSVYGTGRTEPPKHRSGLLAMMLILIIFLCGIITVLGILNVRLFQQLQNQDPAELAISFRDVETQPQETAAVETQPKISSSRQADTINLQSSPASVENVPTEGGLSLQEIYERNIKSVVSINAILTGGSSTGTGVILTEDGYIVTNAHVVENAAAISVQLTDQDIFQAQVIGTDELSDLAVLKISASGLTPAQFGDSSSLRVGDTVVAIGDPLGV